MKNKNGNAKTDDIINSLDGIKKAAAPDFFYTRLKARMEKEYSTGKRIKWMVKPVYALAILVVIVVVNATIIFRNNAEDVNAMNTDNENVQASSPINNINDNFLDDLN